MVALFLSQLLPLFFRMFYFIVYILIPSLPPEAPYHHPSNLVSNRHPIHFNSHLYKEVINSFPAHHLFNTLKCFLKFSTHEQKLVRISEVVEQTRNKQQPDRRQEPPKDSGHAGAIEYKSSRNKEHPSIIKLKVIILKEQPLPRASEPDPRSLPIGEILRWYPYRLELRHCEWDGHVHSFMTYMYSPVCPGYTSS